jgi:hypothetical protein
VITATGHQVGAFGEDQITLVESNGCAHGAKHMTGRLASASTIDLGDLAVKAGERIKANSGGSMDRT